MRPMKLKYLLSLGYECPEAEYILQIAQTFNLDISKLVDAYLDHHVSNCDYYEPSIPEPTVDEEPPLIKACYIAQFINKQFINVLYSTYSKPPKYFLTYTAAVNYGLVYGTPMHNCGGAYFSIMYDDTFKLKLTGDDISVTPALPTRPQYIRRNAVLKINTATDALLEFGLIDSDDYWSTLAIYLNPKTINNISYLDLCGLMDSEIDSHILKNNHLCVPTNTLRITGNLKEQPFEYDLFIRPFNHVSREQLCAH